MSSFLLATDKTTDLIPQALSRAFPAREPNTMFPFDDRIDGRDLRDIAKLTPIGKYLCDLRGAP